MPALPPYQWPLHRTRIRQFRERVEARILADWVPLQARFARTVDPVPFAERQALAYQPIEEGAVWGTTWDSAWFHLTGTIPEAWRHERVVAVLDFNGEGLVFSETGDPLQGLTNGSVFGDLTRNTFRIPSSNGARPSVDLWVEAAANGLSGVAQQRNPPGTLNREGLYEGRVNRIRLARFPEELYHLWLDLEVLEGVLDTVPEDSMRFARLLQGLVAVQAVYADQPENASQCRAFLAPLLQMPAHATTLTLQTVGHAHIDTGWLWPVRETIRKCARTFANQLDLLERYPDYVFGASQPQHYAFVKQHYPTLYARVQEAVASGRWELQGGMWVEPDCNLVSGESLVRQILHGKNFFWQEFGVEVKTCWIPDVFGYSAALPQILRKSGISSFLTQKISWNQFNRFPHHTFRWQGLDGSEVLTHFPPEDTYNSQLTAAGLKKAERQFAEKGFLDTAMNLFGVGDGGGGPTAEMIERGRRHQNLEGLPRVRFGRADAFFEALASQAEELPVWVGELYLEYHRGTYTSQARTKWNNRRLEEALRATEYLYSRFLPLDAYPADTLEATWKTLLLNQFHDILPGSSIGWVYEVTEREHAQALATCAHLQDAAAAVVFPEHPDRLVLLNTLTVPVTSSLLLPSGWAGAQLLGGQPLPTQADPDGSVWAQITVPSQKVLTLERGPEAPTSVPEPQRVLENDWIRYELTEHGELCRAYDKELQREWLPPGTLGNVLSLYEDQPHAYDAWEIDIGYEALLLETAQGQSWTSMGSGPVQQGLRFVLRVGLSTLTQTLTLATHSRELRVTTEVDWQETHRMLRVAFPVAVQSDAATFAVQFGTVKRPTHQNTSWDVARFESVAHQFVDLSDASGGVALLNDGKYGHKVQGACLDLNLLRSPTDPDPHADQGLHRFTYSFFPHPGDVVTGNVWAQAQALNQPPLCFPGRTAMETEAPQVRVVGEGLSLEAFKKAEQEACWVIRIVEVLGRSCTGGLEVPPEVEIEETDLMEWKPLAGRHTGAMPLNFQPFEIRTFKLYPPPELSSDS